MKKLCLLILLFSCAFGKTTTFIPDESGNLISKNSNEHINFEEIKEKNFKKPNFNKAFYRMLLSLFAIITLCFLTFWIFKRIAKSRMTQANSLKALKIIERRVISPKSILYLVEYEGTKVLVSESHLDVKIKILNSSLKMIE